MPPKTIKELVAAYQAKTLNPVDAIENIFAEIKHSKDANIFLSLNEKSAIEAAKLAHQRMKEGEKNPFLGLPICIPDIIDMPPLPTTYGSKLFEDNIPNSIAEDLHKMQTFGFIIIGKTNLSEFGLDYETQNSLLPPTKNPRYPEYSPGGPNGASAAAVAAGFCPIAFATDFSGSIRISGDFCGLVGFVPTHGVLPIAKGKYMPLTERRLLRKGFIAHTIEDVESTFLPLTQQKIINSDKPLKIAYSTNLSFLNVEDDVTSHLRGVVEKLRHAGHHVSEIQPTIDHTMLVHFQNIIAVDRALIIQGILHKQPQNAHLLTDKTKQWLEYAETVSGIDYSYAETYLEWIKDKVEDIFNDYDLFITPVSPVNKFLLGKPPESITQSLVDAWAFTAPYNMSGHPSLAMNGIQVIAKKNNDSFLLSAAKNIAQVL